MSRSRAATREKLLDAARAVMAAEGIQGASVELICEKAGFTRGAFYSNYKSKEELVLAVFGREKDIALANLHTAVEQTAFSGTDDVSEVIANVVNRFFALQPTDRETYVVHGEFILHSIRDAEVASVYREAWLKTVGEFNQAIATVLDLLGLRLTIDLRHATAIIIGTFEIVERDALISGQKFDRSVLTETLPLLILSVTEPVDAD